MLPKIRYLEGIGENFRLTSAGVTPLGETVRVLTVRHWLNVGCPLD